jgi:ABC-2 type transport system permease protein/oleandomycin transport system permease protein
MPMARSAVLAGRLVADTLRMILIVLITIGVSYAVGFRFSNGVAPAVFMVLLAALLGMTLACVAAWTGLAIGDEEAMQAFLMMWVLPLTFVSSAFVQVQTMPGWLQAFAANQPVTSVINTMRALAIGGPVEANLLKSFAWLAGICLVFLPLAVRAYRRAG